MTNPLQGYVEYNDSTNYEDLNSYFNTSSINFNFYPKFYLDIQNYNFSRLNNTFSTNVNLGNNNFMPAQKSTIQYINKSNDTIQVSCSETQKESIIKNSKIYKEYGYLVDQYPYAFGMKSKKSKKPESGRAYTKDEAKNVWHNIIIRLLFFSKQATLIKKQAIKKAISTKKAHPYASTYYLHAMYNDLPIRSVEHIRNTFLRNYIKAKMNRQGYNGRDIPGIFVNKNDPFSKEITKTDVFKEYISYRIRDLINGNTIGTIQKPESINANSSSDKDVLNTLGKFDIVETHIDNDGNIHGYFIDFYDFSDTNPNYKAFTSYKLQDYGYLSNYFIIIEFFVPKNQVKNILLEQINKTNKNKILTNPSPTKTQNLFSQVNNNAFNQTLQASVQSTDYAPLQTVTKKPYVNLGKYTTSQDPLVRMKMLKTGPISRPAIDMNKIIQIFNDCSLRKLNLTPDIMKKAMTYPAAMSQLAGYGITNMSLFNQEVQAYVNSI